MRHRLCPPLSVVRLLVVACCPMFVLGCLDRESSPDSAGASSSLAGVRLRLVVTDDPALAAVVRQLQGEWNAQSGGELEVEETTAMVLATAERLPGDAVLGPAHLLGPLVERKLLAAIPQNLLQDSRCPWSDVFDLVRLGQLTWGGQVWGIPFGSPVLTCCYRVDLLEKLGRQPPRTWSEYQELAKLLQQRFNRGAKEPAASAPPNGQVFTGTCEPLGPGWAGVVLLARAAPYAKHADNYSTLFDISTMEPLVAGPPFVRALEELVRAAQWAPPEQLDYHPAAVREAFWQGRCGLALTWPTAARTVADSKATDFTAAGLRVGFAELPGSSKVYNIGSRAWESRTEGDEGRVPLLEIAGRVGLVAAGSEHAEAAFQLLLWLSSSQGSRICTASPATTLFRHSQVHSPQQWVEREVSASAAVAYASLTEQTLGRQQCLLALPLPGRAEYLAALDAAVQSAVRSQQSPGEALRQAATRWKEITARWGLERQKAAYLRSLGLE